MRQRGAAGSQSEMFLEMARLQLLLEYNEITEAEFGAFCDALEEGKFMRGMCARQRLIDSVHEVRSVAIAARCRLFLFVAPACVPGLLLRAKHLFAAASRRSETLERSWARSVGEIRAGQPHGDARRPG